MQLNTANREFHANEHTHAIITIRARQTNDAPKTQACKLESMRTLKHAVWS